MNQAVKDIVAKLSKDHGKENVMALSDEGVKGIQRITTGCAQLDKAIGGGIPIGRMIELYGMESSGKSTTCLEIVAQFQKAGKIVGYIDSEFALDPVYAKLIGVDVDNIIISQPDDGETAFNILLDMAKSGVGLIIVDSVAALVPKAENEGDMTDQQMGAQARMISKGMRKCTAEVARNNCTVIFTNQIRSKIGVTYGNPNVTPGGNALKFYTSIRIELKSLTSDEKDKNGDRVSKRVKASVVKNKTFPPFRECEFTIRFGEGIDKLESTIFESFDKGLFTRSGAWVYLFGEYNFANGLDAFRSAIQEYGMVEDINEAIKEMNSGKTLDEVKEIVLRNCPKDIYEGKEKKKTKSKKEITVEEQETTEIDVEEV